MKLKVNCLSSHYWDNNDTYSHLIIGNCRLWREVYSEKFVEDIALTELLSSVKYNIKNPELYCVVLWLWSSAMTEMALSFSLFSFLFKRIYTEYYKRLAKTQFQALLINTFVLSMVEGKPFR